MEAPSKSFLTNKLGPLPTWAWMALVLGLLVILKTWQKNKATASATQDPTAPELIGGDQNPPVVFQSYTSNYNTTNPTITAPAQPPGQGRIHPPVHVPPPSQPTQPAPTPTPTPTPAPAPQPTPAPVVPNKPAPAPPAGQWVTVSKFTTKNPPWNSTLSGIAGHLGYGASNWQAIWNAPANAQLKARRKQPNLIQPGDMIFVPSK